MSSFLRAPSTAQAHAEAEKEAAAIAALSAELAAATQRADVAEAALEDARLSIAELERQSDVQVRLTALLAGTPHSWVGRRVQIQTYAVCVSAQGASAK